MLASEEIIAQMQAVADDWLLHFRWDLFCTFDWSRRISGDSYVVWC